MAKGYTRRDAADKAGVSMKTVDNYRKEGLIKGRVQFVDGYGYMRVFTEEEVETVRKTNRERARTMPDSLYVFTYGERQGPKFLDDNDRPIKGHRALDPTTVGEAEELQTEEKADDGTTRPE